MYCMPLWVRLPQVRRVGEEIAERDQGQTAHEVNDIAHDAEERERK